MHSYILPTKVCEFRFVLELAPEGSTSTRPPPLWSCEPLWRNWGYPPGVMRRLLAQQSGRINKARELIVQASSHRSQLQNKEAAVRRVEKLITAAYHVPKQRQATKPTAASKRRRVDKKKQRGSVKTQRQRPSIDG